ncbi:hypothetical protein K7472_20740 [Streptomyces sp. PTM05]|uniref:STAS domain-containing protein n=1 Tax=Streptantibioticus parmotrematis TaxID=2873249 RepID=A0ABS7QWG1_9ACTN|nr:STAS domain-containing protein [Streptantibioticus parmotrematis]MBY8887253.1 hypothetical protein [Streptantibioticus parmotrematis]
MDVTKTIDGVNASIAPHGDIDFDALPSLLHAVAALPSTVTVVTWDLHDVPFMDLAGLHLLNDQRHRRTVIITGLRPQPRRLIRVATELFSTLPAHQQPA